MFTAFYSETHAVLKLNVKHDPKIHFRLPRFPGYSKAGRTTHKGPSAGDSVPMQKEHFAWGPSLGSMPEHYIAGGRCQIKLSVNDPPESL